VIQLKKRRAKSRKKSIKFVIICMFIILAGVISAYVTYHYNKTKYWNDLIYPGVIIQDVKVGGKTKEEAKKAVNERIKNINSKRKIYVIINDNKYELDYLKINPNYNIDEVVNDAFKYGKNLNLFKRYNLIKNPENKTYKLKFNYNENNVKDFIKKIQYEVNKNPINAKLIKNGGNFSIINGQKGIKLENEKLDKDLKQAILNNENSDVKVNGATKEVLPNITSDKLYTVNYQIASFSTHFASISSPQRSNNISIATKSINGTVIMPGDIFSFNDIVGQRTAARGYQAAPVIIGDHVEAGLGGGICQVSSTLYNTAVRAGMQTVERTHHSLPVNYVPKGMDATVDYGNIDYKFKNTRQYPIYIEGYTSAGSVVFNIYCHR
jgi:vancomycin resistance protein YoaR